MFRSASAGPLALPWELLRDPAQPTPLALDRVAVSRSLPTAALEDRFTVAGTRLRVLMVISRPGGAADVGYRMIARRLLERLDAVRGTAVSRQGLVIDLSHQLKLTAAAHRPSTSDAGLPSGKPVAASVSVGTRRRSEMGQPNSPRQGV